MEQLNAYLETNSYLGGAGGVTLEDYKKCDEIKEGSFNASALPHLNRWYKHVSFLKSKYPKFDYLGVEIAKGTPPSLGRLPKTDAPKSPKQSPKKDKVAAPKKDTGPKKDAAAKKDAAPKKDEKKLSPEEEAKAKLLKKVIKEGGKRGVEIEGAADMGGLQFFCTSVDEPQGDLEMLEESLNAMNAQPVEGEEERKGCSGHIGKTIFSAGPEQLAIAAYVPEAKQGDLSCEEWLKHTLKNFGGEIISVSKGLCQGRVKTNSDKGVFPLKIREPMILEANNYLRSKGLFPDDNSDSDEMVFGDDDFPS